MLQYIDTQKKELCCGCRACEQICHVHAIIMKEDEEGFLYPHLNMNFVRSVGCVKKFVLFQSRSWCRPRLRICRSMQQ